jgi:ectoine hydroxylase-related dioxygenase (phytanoyl-CoA dioxygenase family)
VPAASEIDTDGPLSAPQLANWRHDGYVVLRGLLSRVAVGAMLDRAVELARHHAEAGALPRGFLVPERNAAPTASAPEDRVSKIFLLHEWDPVFGPAARHPAVVDVVAQLLGPDIDCFLSQFIFKSPGAIGQPWHQDSFYFPFEPDRQVGVWIAVTEATKANGPLWVLPGSHTEPVHEHVADTRPGANVGYTEIVDHDMSAEIPVLLDPGDVLVFDSHLMHRSTDNDSDGLRAAMVFHYALADTVDRSAPAVAADADALGAMPDGVVEAAARTGSVYDAWMPVRRGGRSALT